MAKRLKPIDHKIVEGKESGKTVQVEQYTITEVSKLEVWIEKYNGEGMMIDTHSLFKVIDRFYKDNF